MLKRIYKNRQDFLHKINSAITRGMDEEVSALIYLAYSKGITESEVAEALGVSKSAVSQKYPIKNSKK